MGSLTYLNFFSLYATDGKLDILMIINGILGALVGKNLWNVIFFC